MYIVYIYIYKCYTLFQAVIPSKSRMFFFSTRSSARTLLLQTLKKLAPACILAR